VRERSCCPPALVWRTQEKEQPLFESLVLGEELGFVEGEKMEEKLYDKQVW
jgi:hypothetical protein